jgi:hypothetical protein
MRPRQRLPIGALVSAAGVAVALGVAILAVGLLGNHARATRSPAISKPLASPRHSGALRLLEGNGIGSIHFGETPASVDSGLARLFGRPKGGSYVRSICGFDHASYWIDLLDVRPKNFPGTHLFSASLVVLFKRSHFVGYVYNDDQAIAPGAVADETHLPLNSSQARQLLRGPRLTLRTARGLLLGDPLAQARRLYGRAFVETTQVQGTPPNPRLGRAPIWEVETPNGRLYGAIDNPQTTRSFYGSSRRSIGSISAGQNPNTPCR